MSIFVAIVTVIFAAFLILIVTGASIVFLGPPVVKRLNSSTEMTLVVVISALTIFLATFDLFTIENYYTNLAVVIFLIPFSMLKLFAYWVKKPEPTQIHVRVLVPAAVGPSVGAENKPMLHERFNKIMARLPRYFRRGLLAMPMIAVYCAISGDWTVPFNVLFDCFIISMWDRWNVFSSLNK